MGAVGGRRIMTCQHNSSKLPVNRNRIKLNSKDNENPAYFSIIIGYILYTLSNYMYQGIYHDSPTIFEGSKVKVLFKYSHKWGLLIVL